MKKLFFLAAAMVAATALFAADPVMIRVDSWDQAGLTKEGDSIIATFTRDDVQVLALNTKDSKNKYNKFVAIETITDPSKWKYEGVDPFLARLKMRGKSASDARQIIIPVKKNDKVEIFAQSGKSSEERTFEVAQAQWDGSAEGTEFKTALESKIGKFDYNVAADGNIYIWCPGNEVNFFAFRITAGGATGIENTAAEVKTVKTFENGQLVIIKNGVKYNATGAIVK